MERVFVSEAEGDFLLAQWKVVASTHSTMTKVDGKKLSKALRNLAASDNRVVVQQVVAAVGDLGKCEAALRSEEQNMNEIVFALYSLTEAERALVQLR